MDRGSRSAGSRDARLPRTRGDGPHPTTSGHRRRQASPHARGWTLGRRGGPVGWRGFPARAGMDPGDTCGSSPGVRLPRTRGDGPHRDPPGQLVQVASPHARGWTGSPGRGAGDGRGFPARAGMDPGRVESASPLSRLPRTRGDGPLPRTMFGWRTGASPHARGWTRRDRPPAGDGGGFPARAGMDPQAARSRVSELGLPRTRGDGPAAATISG